MATEPSFSPCYDEAYYEHNDERPRKRNLYECVCGYEYLCESFDEDPIALCDCGAPCCPDCTHTCEWCGVAGCESCMTHTIDGWCHTGDCAEKNKQAMDLKED